MAYKKILQVKLLQLMLAMSSKCPCIASDEHTFNCYYEIVLQWVVTYVSEKTNTFYFSAQTENSF